MTVKGDKQPERQQPIADVGPTTDPIAHTLEVGGHEAAVRGTSATPGEAESQGSGEGAAIGLTDRLDELEYESVEGIEGSLGGANYRDEAGEADGTSMDEFGEDGEPRRPVEDW